MCQRKEMKIMKHANDFITGTAVVFLLGGIPLVADHGRGGGHMPGPPAGAASHGTPPAQGHHRGIHNGAGMHDEAVNKLARNPALSNRLQPLLPPGTNVQTAAQGFKNTGQFVAALHVSRNLNIPFDQLKAKMTGPNRESLGHAIHDLRPDLSNKTIKTDVKVADRQAKQDLEQVEKEHET